MGRRRATRRRHPWRQIEADSRRRGAGDLGHCWEKNGGCLALRSGSAGCGGVEDLRVVPHCVLRLINEVDDATVDGEVEDGCMLMAGLVHARVDGFLGAGLFLWAD